MKLDTLFSFQEEAIRQTPSPAFQRLKLRHDQQRPRTVALVGMPGSGKTTSLLHHAQQYSESDHQCLYVNLEHPMLYTWPLEDLANAFYDYGGRQLLIDDLHKYPNWSESLEHIVRRCPEMQVVFSTTAEGGLSECPVEVTARKMPCLSFREYLKMQQGKNLPTIPLEHILRFHRQFEENVNTRVTVLPQFKEYLKYGSLPATVTSTHETFRAVMFRIINQTIEQDLCAVHCYHHGHARNLKQILGHVAQKAPGKVNISALARQLTLGRDTIKRYLHDLEEAGLITLVFREGNKQTMLCKPDKVYLQNPNLCYALQPRARQKAISETFLLNQLVNAGHRVHLTGKGHLLVDGTYTIETTERGEKHLAQQRRNHFMAVSDITSGSLTSIPLWLFGFMY